jgi:hypothetical protein
LKPTFAIFLHHPTCSADSVNGVMEAFSPMARLKIFTKQKVAEGFFNDVDVVVFPGGDGEATAFRSVLKPNLPDVRSYMSVAASIWAFAWGRIGPTPTISICLRVHAVCSTSSDHEPTSGLPTAR